MQSESNSIQVYFAEEFKRNLRALSKKYRRIRSDVEPIVEQLKLENCREIESLELAILCLRYGSKIAISTREKALDID